MWWVRRALCIALSGLFSGASSDVIIPRVSFSIVRLLSSDFFSAQAYVTSLGWPVLFRIGLSLVWCLESDRECSPSWFAAYFSGEHACYARTRCPKFRLQNPRLFFQYSPQGCWYGWMTSHIATWRYPEFRLRSRDMWQNQHGASPLLYYSGGLLLLSYKFMFPRGSGTPVWTPSLRFCNMTRNSNGIILGSIYGSNIWPFLDAVNVQGWYSSIVQLMRHRGNPRYCGVFVFSPGSGTLPPHSPFAKCISIFIEAM